jgi:three-Cys-motif partner protein
MVEKRYSWETGATLEEHSKRKHKIVREYFARYLAVRCQLPMQSKFRLAIVDGFAGGGRYKCGSPGSPIIFIEELRLAAEELNIKRQRRKANTIRASDTLRMKKQLSFPKFFGAPTKPIK